MLVQPGLGKGSRMSKFQCSVALTVALGVASCVGEADTPSGGVCACPPPGTVIKECTMAKPVAVAPVLGAGPIGTTPCPCIDEIEQTCLGVTVQSSIGVTR